jgi:hypothetical protein
MIYEAFKPKWNSLTTIQESKPKTQNANQNKLNVKEICIKTPKTLQNKNVMLYNLRSQKMFSNHMAWDYIMHIKYLESCSL